MTWIERSLQTTTCRLFIKIFMCFACMHKKAKELWNESGKVKLPHISLNKHLSPQIWTRATHKQYTKKANVVYSNLPERKQFDASDKTPDILKWWFKLRFSNYFRWKSTFCQKNTFEICTTRSVLFGLLARSLKSGFWQKVDLNKFKFCFHGRRNVL